MTDWSTGVRLGHYELLTAVGSDGMGEVWKGRDSRRFTSEARAIAALNHPHVCQIYDVGPDYMVLEFVEASRSDGRLTSTSSTPRAWH